MALKKSELRGGMKVYNKTSRSIGTVRAEPDGTLRLVSSWVEVHTTVRTGKNAGQCNKTEWLVKHLAIIPTCRDQLKPRVYVQNIVSGTCGVIARREGKLTMAADFCAVVKYRIQSGKREGQMTSKLWRLHNMIIFPDAPF